MLSQKDMQYLLGRAQEMVLVFQVDGTISYANQSAIDLLELRNSSDKCNITDIFPQEFPNGQDVLVGNAVFDMDKVATNAYRRNRTCFAVDARFVRCEEDKYCCMAVDTAEKDYLLKKNEQVIKEAEEALKIKSEFMANVTHELRTPVNGILGNTRALMDIEDDRGKKRILDIIAHGCDDMNAIINNILDFSKLDAGKFTLEKREFVFRDMIDYVTENHKNKINEKGLEFAVTVSPDIPQRLVGDELRIVQVLNNLLSNATKFTTVGKIGLQVVLTSCRSNRVELFFLVVDTGIGIDKDGLEKLFHSFSQVDASISRRFGGTGLGLNISKQLVELMDGSIHVESEPNRGSVFSFHIWLDVPADETNSMNFVKELKNDTSLMKPTEIIEQVWEYGTKENLEEIERKMSRLILAVEMGNWEKAEMFSDALRKLTDKAPQNVKSNALRLKMAVQKEDYEKTTESYATLEQLI